MQQFLLTLVLLLSTFGTSASAQQPASAQALKAAAELKVAIDNFLAGKDKLEGNLDRNSFAEVISQYQELERALRQESAPGTQEALLQRRQELKSLEEELRLRADIARIQQDAVKTTLENTGGFGMYYNTLMFLYLDLEDVRHAIGDTLSAAQRNSRLIERAIQTGNTVERRTITPEQRDALIEALKQAIEAGQREVELEKVPQGAGDAAGLGPLLSPDTARKIDEANRDRQEAAEAASGDAAQRAAKERDAEKEALTQRGAQAHDDAEAEAQKRQEEVRALEEFASRNRAELERLTAQAAKEAERDLDQAHRELQATLSRPVPTPELPSGKAPKPTEQQDPEKGEQAEAESSKQEPTDNPSKAAQAPERGVRMVYEFPDLPPDVDEATVQRIILDQTLRRLRELEQQDQDTQPKRLP